MAINVTTVALTGAGILTRGAGEVWYTGGGGGTSAAGISDPGAVSTGGGGGTGGGGSDPGSRGGIGTGGGGGGGGATGGGGGGGMASGQSAGPLALQPAIGDTPVAGPITRAEVLARGRYWTSQGVPYSMSGYTNDPQGKIYRTDCSGLVSMSLHLDDSLSTVTLPSQCYQISKAELKPADIVGNLGGGTAGAAGHVMIFNGWVDESMTTFRTIEETPPRAVERTRTWGAAAYCSYAFRYLHLADP